MVKANSILKNSAFLMGSNLFQRFISIFTLVIVTRYLGPELYGQYTFIITFASTFAILWNFGLNTLLTRDVAADKTRTERYMGSMIMIKAALFVVILPFMILYLKVLNYDNTVVLAASIFVMGSFLSSITGIFRSVFSAYRRMEFVAMQNILRPVILLTGLYIVFTLKKTGSVVDVIICYFFAFFAVFLFFSVICRWKITAPSFAVNIPFIVDLLKKGFPFLMISFVNIILFKVDHLMLSKMAGDLELGYYGAAYTLFDILLAFFPMIIMNASFPVLSMQYKNDIDEMRKLCNILMKYFLLIGIPMSCGLCLLGEEIMLGLYGESFREAGDLMSLLGFSIWICFITSLTSWILTAVEKQHLVLLSGSCAMLLNIGLNLLLIPAHGAKGAAVTTIICEAAQMVMMFIMFRRALAVKFDVKLIQILISTVVMGCFVAVVKEAAANFHVSVLLTIAVSGAVFIYFFLLSVCFKSVSKKEIGEVLAS